MGYVLVKAPFGEDSSMNVAVGSGGPQVLLTGAGGWDRDRAVREHGEDAAAAGEPWARLGQMAAIGGGVYGALNALNESLASGQGGGLLQDAGMGAYGGYATLSPLSSYGGNRAARNFAARRDAEKEEKGRQEEEGKQHERGIQEEQANYDQGNYRQEPFGIPAPAIPWQQFWGPSEQVQRHGPEILTDYTPPAPPTWVAGLRDTPTMVGSTQAPLDVGLPPPGAGEGPPPLDKTIPAHVAVMSSTASPASASTGTPDDEMVEELKQRRLDSY